MIIRGRLPKRDPVKAVEPLSEHAKDVNENDDYIVGQLAKFDVLVKRFIATLESPLPKKEVFKAPKTNKPKNGKVIHRKFPYVP